MMIETKYHGPTNTRGARISARCHSKRKSYGWRYEIGTEENHKSAAMHFYAWVSGLSRHGLKMVGHEHWHTGARIWIVTKNGKSRV